MVGEVDEVKVVPSECSQPWAKEVCPVPPWERPSVPTMFAKAMPRVEVATQDGAPVVKEVWRIVPPVDEATLESVVGPDA